MTDFKKKNREMGEVAKKCNKRKKPARTACDTCDVRERCDALKDYAYGIISEMSVERRAALAGSIAWKTKVDWKPSDPEAALLMGIKLAMDLVEEGKNEFVPMQIMVRREVYEAMIGWGTLIKRFMESEESEEALLALMIPDLLMKIATKLGGEGNLPDFLRNMP